MVQTLEKSCKFSNQTLNQTTMGQDKFQPNKPTGHNFFQRNYPGFEFYFITKLICRQCLCQSKQSEVAQAGSGGTKIDWTFPHKNWYFTAPNYTLFWKISIHSEKRNA